MSNLSQFLGGSSPKVSEFTATGTFTKPTNTAWVTALLVGAGGGGGGGNGVNAGGGGGGGGLSHIPPQIYLTGNLTVSIGAGGTAGAFLSTGGTGGSTSITTNFPSSITFSAAGGTGGHYSGGGGYTGGSGGIQTDAIVPIGYYDTSLTTWYYTSINLSSIGYPNNVAYVASSNTRFVGGGAGGSTIAGYASGWGRPGGTTSPGVGGGGGASFGLFTSYTPDANSGGGGGGASGGTSSGLGLVGAAGYAVIFYMG